MESFYRRRTHEPNEEKTTSTDTRFEAKSARQKEKMDRGNNKGGPGKVLHFRFKRPVDVSILAMINADWEEKWRVGEWLGLEAAAPAIITCVRLKKPFFEDACVGHNWFRKQASTKADVSNKAGN